MTEQAAPAQDELRAWRRIEERWKALGKEMTQANRRDHEIKAIRFLGHILQEQQDTTIAPTRLLTPQGYACLYHSMHWVIAYTRFVDLNRQQRSDAIVRMGWTAFKAIRTRTPLGKTPSREWATFAQDAIRRSGAIEPTCRHQTMQDVLDSDLPDSYKFWACKGLAPDDWLDHELQVGLRLLMPQKEHACFPCLPLEDHGASADLNMRIVHAYCPEMHAVLAGLMPEQAWASRKVMLRYAAELMPRKNTQSLALPDAFDID